MATASKDSKHRTTKEVTGPLAASELKLMDAYWRASNYLSVGQIYLFDNPLLRKPLKREHVKPRLVGHWGTTPGLNFMYVHLNRVIKRDDLNMIYVIGPGHGGPALVAHAYLEGTYSEFYPNIGQDEEGMKRPGHRRMSDNPHANGGLLLRDLKMPDFRNYAVKVPKPGAVNAESTRSMGTFLRDVMKLNLDAKNFRLFSPDENNSNRWQDVLEVTNRCYVAEILPEDDHLAPDGRVMEVLSEHQCQGWLEGYLLTGRHGFFSCYEAFIHIIDSMFNQHAKWLKVCNHIPWRRPIGSLNYLLSSHVWRQDHNGFSHQDPGFIDHAVRHGGAQRTGSVLAGQRCDRSSAEARLARCLRQASHP